VIPNGHATFKLGEGILVTTLRLCLGGRVLGLLGSSRAVAGLVERRGCAASRRVAVVVLLLMVVMTVVAVAVQLAIPLLPLDLLVLQSSVVGR